MLNLYTPVVKKQITEEKFNDGEKLSILYHDLFDYPLTFAELIKWQSGKSATGTTNFTGKDGFYFLEGRESLIYQRFLRKRVSLKKMEIAKKASKVLSYMPTIKMVAVTGSLAMGNATSESDIDLMIVAKKGSLWTSRLAVHLLLAVFGIPFRRAGKKEEKDKLCLNMWLDESDLTFRQRNLYTAHEIAQITPLVNKDSTYEKFLSKNKWILRYWPNAVRIRSLKSKINDSHSEAGIIEWLSYKLQGLYMRSKITRETITPTRALFHPQDWAKVVLDRLEINL